VIVPPVFDLLNLSAVTALVGTNPVRVFQDECPLQPPVYPYIVWSIVSGIPSTTFELPGFDNRRIQVDCYVMTKPKDAEALGNAARNAIENDGENVLVSENGGGRDPDTKAFRDSRDYSIWVER
jgi:hypothetical protein